jgi:hypothetical protein
MAKSRGKISDEADIAICKAATSGRALVYLADGDGFEP